jgi:hypothetical protein
MLLVALACHSASPPPAAPAELACRQDVLDPRELQGAPAWVTNCAAFAGAPPGVLCAVGRSREPSPSLAQSVATTMARGELAAGLEARLSKDVVVREQSDSVGGQTKRGSQASQRLEQVVEATMSGSSNRDEWISPCGTLHALVVLEPSAVERAEAQLGAR